MERYQGELYTDDHDSGQVKMVVVCFTRLFSGVSNTALTLLRFGF